MSGTGFLSGLDLSEAFFKEAVAPLLETELPRLRYSCGLIGSGSEVLGFDDQMSSDHHWGPRALLFLSDADRGQMGHRITELLAGDELGSAIIGARLVRDIMRLCFLMEKQYIPYSKWFGTAFKFLPSAAKLTPLLEAVFSSSSWKERQRYLSLAYEVLARMLNSCGVTEPLPITVEPFFGRPFFVISKGRFSAAIKEKIEDPEVKALASRRLIGSVDLFSDSTDILSDSCWFPNILALRGCDLVLCAAAQSCPSPAPHKGSRIRQNYPIPMGADPYHWHHFRVRAGENNLYFAFSNPLDREHGYFGLSGIFGPDTFSFPRSEAIVNIEEGVAILEIDTTNLSSNYPTNVVRRKDLVAMRQPLQYKELLHPREA